MSGSVFLSNLDDFIAPSQACVNPLVSSKLEASTDAVQSSSAKLVITNDYSKTEFDSAPIKPNLINTKTSSSKKVASVSLNDCLACSGCVTSAETILIQEQSYEKLIVQLSVPVDQRPTIVVAISPNSLASIGAFLNMNTVACFLRVAAALKQLGVTYVFDTSSAGDIALIEAREEFLARYKQGQKRTWERPPTTTAVSNSSIHAFVSVGAAQYDASDVGAASMRPELRRVGTAEAHTQLPVLSSHCPGWVCYAEKSQPQAIPYVSTVKSAQQILGSVTKAILSQDSAYSGVTAPGCKNGVYFVSVQPCFDKKLEASRLDFYNTEENSTEVDLVLSTTELWRLLESLAASPASPTRRGGSVCCAEADEDSDELITAVVKKARLCESEGACTTGACEKMQECTALEEGGPEVATEAGEMSVAAYLSTVRPDDPQGRDAVEAMARSVSADGRAFAVAADRNSGSGGYAEYLFKYAAEALYGVNLWELRDLPYKEGRNADIAEIDINAVSTDASDVVVTDGSSPRKLKFARAYGFRNIQSIMLKVRRGTCDFDFVEIMACPSGCNNGGGQLRQAGAVDAVAAGVESGSAKETPTQAKERVVEVEAAHHASLQVRRPEDSPLARYLYAPDRVGTPLSEAAMRLLHTRYHAVPKLDVIAPLATKW